MPGLTPKVYKVTFRRRIARWVRRRQWILDTVSWLSSRWDSAKVRIFHR